MLGMLVLMRQVHERVLAAKGITLGSPIVARGLRVFSAHDQSGTKLLFRGKISGPSWASITNLLDLLDIQYSLFEVGNIWLLADDSERTRLLIKQLYRRARQGASELVFVPDVGFVAAGSKKRFDIRTLIGPITIAVVSLIFTFFASTWTSETQVVSVEEQVDCALDLPPGELKDWVASGIMGRDLGDPAKILVTSELGLLNLEIAQTLGTTQSLTGLLECQDGRKQQLHFRLDSSANGGLVELGQKLNP